MATPPRAARPDRRSRLRRAVDVVASKPLLAWLVVAVILAVVWIANQKSLIVEVVFFVGNLAGVMWRCVQSVRGYTITGAPTKRRLARQAKKRRQEVDDHLAEFNRAHPPIPDPLFEHPPIR